MRSPVSPSTPSPESPRRRRRAWQVRLDAILLPVLVAIVQALAITPLLYLFFGEEFGLTGGRPVMWPGGVALVGLMGYLATKFVTRITTNATWVPVILGVCWLVTALAWIAIEPVYDAQGLLVEPGSLVGERAWLIAPLLLSLGVWWQGIRYATIDFLMSAEEIRGSTQRAWLVLIGSLIFAAFLGNDAGRTALGTTAFVVPALMISSVALVAAAEIHQSRLQISQSGGRPPTWSRWARLVGTLGIAIAVFALVVLVLLTPGAFATMIAAISATARAAGQLLLWVLYGVLYILYYVFYAFSELVSSIFGLEFGPMDAPEQPPAVGQGPLQFEQAGEDEPWPYAYLLRWGLLGIVVLAVIALLFRMARRGRGDDASEIGEEERTSVFSTDLAREQLRNLFRRGPRNARLRHLDLDSAPTSVRDTWRYLQILAIRQDAGRTEAETPQDFAARLRAGWPGTAASLNDLAIRYERSRYGDIDSERDYTAALDDWADIHARRKSSDASDSNSDSQ